MNSTTTKIFKNLMLLVILSFLMFSCTKKEGEESTEKIDNESSKPVKVVSWDKLKEKNGIMYEFMKSIPFTGKSEKYTKDSLLYQEKTYKLGKLNGKMTFRYSNGQKEFEFFWLSGY
jgi:antitoxin component YwqK of YwqJK toxin-antitoxin module